MCDDFFLRLIEEDVTDFLLLLPIKSDKPSPILLFPPLLSRYRFAIHQAIEAGYPQLSTLSVGREDERRTVVFLKNSLKMSSSSPARKVDTPSPDPKTGGGAGKRNAKPSLQPYVPPALRNRDGATSPRPREKIEKSSSAAGVDGEKRGVRKVRSKALPDAAETSAAETHCGRGDVPTSLGECRDVLNECVGKEQSRETAEPATCPVSIKVSPQELVVSVKEAASVSSPPETSPAEPQPQRNRTARVIIRADTEELVNLIAPPSSPPTTTTAVAHGIIKVANLDKEVDNDALPWKRTQPHNNGTARPGVQTTPLNSPSTGTAEETKNQPETAWKRRPRSPSETSQPTSTSTASPVCSHPSSGKSKPTVKAEPKNLLTTDTAGKAEEESETAWKRRPRSPSETSQPTSTSTASPVSIHPSSGKLKPTVKAEPKNLLTTDTAGKAEEESETAWKRRPRSPSETSQPTSTSTASPVSILQSTVISKLTVKPDPKLSTAVLAELTAAFGDVSVQHATSSYKPYSPVTFDGSDDDGYLHVLEVYDFPATFSTGDLTREIQMLTQEVIEIHWVDDTRAICVCPSVAAARHAMTMKSPLGRVKLRPLTEASEQTKRKAKACVQMDALGVAKQRPETSAAAARRMVAGALGVKIAVPREKREQEREQLNTAKEKKVQAVERKVKAVKKKEDIWEGRV
ncbi:hypothetical protein BV898_11059 [Hypsibius exemplaris]|uniref:R3H domain-containing protein n=1 Tax=Hypsibius exemplaris TaxID=2072580 RepID=A0A1W0WHY0_HYPEX|nr:hypothetical protein BV898_11059 [Hypsibius exemplaris]